MELSLWEYVCASLRETQTVPVSHRALPTFPRMWSDTERWGSHSFTHYANKPTLRQAFRAGRATDTIPHYVEMDEGQTEASRALSASVRLGTLSRHRVPESLLPFLQITLAVAHALPQVLFQARCMGTASQSSMFFPTEQRDWGVHCAHHDHISDCFLKSICVSGRGSGRACVFLRARGWFLMLRRSTT